MSRFLVLLCAKTILNFPEEGIYKFNIGDSTILLRQLTNSKDKIVSGLRHGVMIEVQIDAENLDDAISKAIDLSEFLMSALCFETVNSVHRSNIILVYEISNDAEKRIFRQYFHDLPFSVDGIQIKPQSYAENAQRIWSYTSKYKDRIFRSIRWFRKGIISDDPLDQFLFFWHGLESLNSALAEHFGCEKSIKVEIERQCKVCDEKYTDLITVLGGIEALYDDMKIDKSIRKNIKSIRNGISHGYDNVSDLYGLAIEILPILSKILHCGISKILDISFEDSFYLVFKRVGPVEVGHSVFVEGFLIEAELSKLGIGSYYPYLAPDMDNISTNEGETNFKFDKEMECEFEEQRVGVSGKDIKMELKNDE